MLSNAVSRGQVLMGKFIGGYISITCPFLAAALIALLFFALSPSIAHGREEWMRIAALTLVSLGYIAVFFCLGLAVSALASRAGTAVVMLLAIWVMLTLVVPNVGWLIAKQLVQVPSQQQIDTQKIQKAREIEDEAEKKGLKNVGATPGYGLVHPEAQRKITEIQKVIEERYIVLKRKRQALSQILTRLSPVGVYVHAVSEVTAGVSIEECRDLVSAVRSSKAKYMMAENYTYMKPNVLVGELVKRGLFGDIYYAEGAYIHELKGLNERTPWRRRWQTGVNGSTYSTHSLGPVLQWFAGQRVVAVCTVGCGHHYRDARNELYEMEDSVTMMCRLSGGGLAHIRVDMLSDRPHNMVRYALQGTDGCYESTDGYRAVPKVWLNNRSGSRWRSWRSCCRITGRIRRRQRSGRATAGAITGRCRTSCTPSSRIGSRPSASTRPWT